LSLETSRFQLFSALKALRLRWDDVCGQWDDAVRRDFEAEFWNHVEPGVTATLTALDRLAQVIGQLKRECQGDSEQVFSS
jgi:hypothetical protein